MKNNKVSEGEITIFLDSSVYSKNGIMKCLYWSANKFRTTIQLEDGYYMIKLTAKNEIDFKEEELEKYLIKLEQEFIDFNLRDIVSKETKTIRELLIAKAFSHGEYKEKPPGELDER